MLRAVAPRPWAIAIQTVASPCPNAPNAREIGPRPLRTARGAGRRFLVEPVLRGFFLPLLRDRVLEPPRPDELLDRLEPDLLDRDEDVLLLRDPGGEDVRVAMVMNLGQSHTSHRDHTMRVGERGSDSPVARRTKMDVVRHVRRGAAALALCVVIGIAAGGCQEQGSDDE